LKQKDFSIWCDKNQIEILEENTIPHGKQLKIQRGPEKLNVNFYTSGKSLVQGKESALKKIVDSALGVKDKPKKASEVLNLPEHRYALGIDESGKGDYFGPLVVAAALIDTEQVPALLKLGVKDSKKLSDAKILEMGPKVREMVKHFILAINPKKYNDLYKTEQNLNRMLAKAHIHTFEKVAHSEQVDLVISDQFAHDKKFLLSFIPEKLKHIPYFQRTKGEEEMAVACASIMAREKFLQTLVEMSDHFDFFFPKGAGDNVKAEARKFIAISGRDALMVTAKVHFSITEEILQ
jgi:ribonuclease HIII